MEQALSFFFKACLVLALPLIPAGLIVRKVESWGFQLWAERSWPGTDAWKRIRPWGWGLAIAVYFGGAVWLAVRLF